MTKVNRNDVYDDLRRRILTLELAPGRNLEEERLSGEYGISRTPLRDILRQLAGDGYVEIVGNRGASVASMNHKMLRDFFLTAPTIYSMVARLAVQNATTAKVRELKQTQRAFSKAAKGNRVDALVSHNERFHALLGEMADNQYLSPALGRLLIDHSRIAYTFYERQNAKTGDRLSQAVAQHDEMIEAIEAGDEQRIVDVTLAHWELSRSQADIFVRDDPLDLDV